MQSAFADFLSARGCEIDGFYDAVIGDLNNPDECAALIGVSNRYFESVGSDLRTIDVKPAPGYARRRRFRVDV